MARPFVELFRPVRPDLLATYTVEA